MHFCHWIIYKYIMFRWLIWNFWQYIFFLISLSARSSEFKNFSKILITSFLNIKHYRYSSFILLLYLNIISFQTPYFALSFSISVEFRIFETLPLTAFSFLWNLSSWILKYSQVVELNFQHKTKRSLLYDVSCRFFRVKDQSQSTILQFCI